MIKSWVSELKGTWYFFLAGIVMSLCFIAITSDIAKTAKTNSENNFEPRRPGKSIGIVSEANAEAYDMTINNTKGNIPTITPELILSDEAGELLKYISSFKDSSNYFIESPDFYIVDENLHTDTKYRIYRIAVDRMSVKIDNPLKIIGYLNSGEMPPAGLVSP